MNDIAAVGMDKKNIGSAVELPTAILLASGLSTRMGCCKQLRPLYGKPLIQYIAETLLEAGLPHLVITVNAETRHPITEMIERLTQKQKPPVQNSFLKVSSARSGASRSFHCDIIFNSEPERGQGHSAALAVQAACVRHAETLAVNRPHAHHPTGFLFCTADQPFLQTDSIRELCAVFQKHPERIISAAFNGKRCSPVIFPAALADELSRLNGNIGGRTVMNAHPNLILYSPLHSEKEAFDIDTPEDFKRAEEYLNISTNN